MFVKLLFLSFVVTLTTANFCCENGDVLVCSEVCPNSNQTYISECNSTSSIGDVCSGLKEPLPCEHTCGDCEVCVDGTCTINPIELNDCQKCGTECKRITNNVAFVDASLIVGGIDVGKKLADCKTLSQTIDAQNAQIQNLTSIIDELRINCTL